MTEEKERPAEYHSNGSWAGEGDFINVNDGMIRRNADYEHRVKRMGARKEVAWAVKHEVLTRPDTCSKCGQPPKKGAIIQAHHESYDQDKWLDVVWLCAGCHMKLHGRKRQLPWLYDEE